MITVEGLLAQRTSSRPGRGMAEAFPSVLSVSIMMAKGILFLFTCIPLLFFRGLPDQPKAVILTVGRQFSTSITIIFGLTWGDQSIHFSTGVRDFD